jgi:hypothetical protein
MCLLSQTPKYDPDAKWGPGMGERVWHIFYGNPELHDLCLCSQIKKFGFMCYRIKATEDTFTDIFKLKNLEILRA